jgi:hypothetical protein
MRVRGLEEHSFAAFWEANRARERTIMTSVSSIVYGLLAWLSLAVGGRVLRIHLVVEIGLMALFHALVFSRPRINNTKSPDGDVSRSSSRRFARVKGFVCDGWRWSGWGCLLGRRSAGAEAGADRLSADGYGPVCTTIGRVFLFARDARDG